ncbi:uncharacterized protein LOC132747195 [Ruditapes philippinarum]|uniref:uncharacterized protein LOC132747195 n=1 Tax=Ruditapes philippinarum TaxID=129788 RepID=UPI00295BFD82|nr:uncharacterized protein LOC132747195 [Ruditapes philippinarum]
MMRLVLLTITLAVLLVDSSKAGSADLVCHHWTEEDTAAIPQPGTIEDQRKLCEDILGYTFTQGKNEEYPGCGECWCCKPKDLVCHHWTEEDTAAIPQPGTIEDQRKLCEDILGYTFTQGKNEEYPRCGECWCCKPESTP